MSEKSQRTGAPNSMGSRPANLLLPEAARAFLPPYKDGPAPLRRIMRDAENPEHLTTVMDSFGAKPDGLFIPVCYGLRPDMAREYKGDRYAEFSMVNLCVYRDLERHFRERGTGFEAFRTSHAVCIVCTVPKEDRDCYSERHILPPIQELEQRYGIRMLAGIGLPTERPEELGEACSGAEYAFHLFYFEPKRVIDLREHRTERSFIMDQYVEAENQVFRAILMQNSSVEDRLRDCVDLIGRIHYGNRNAAKMHTMELVGSLTARLKSYRLLDQDYFELMARIQEEVLSSITFHSLRESVLSHFRALLPQVYSNDRPKGKLVIEQVKEYIALHYMENLNIQKLAGVAYVSPDYFSHMFKTETGKNYKAFLTEIRMDHAVELLRETDLHISEISEKVGYKNPRTFMDAFKNAYDMGPMEYRRMHRRQGR